MITSKVIVCSEDDLYDCITEDKVEIGERVFKVTYGERDCFYRLSTLNKMFDSKIKKIDPMTNKPLPEDFVNKISAENEIDKLLQSRLLEVISYPLESSNLSFIEELTKLNTRRKEIKQVSEIITKIKNLYGKNKLEEFDTEFIKDIVKSAESNANDFLNYLIEFQEKMFENDVSLIIIEEKKKQINVLIPNCFFWAILPKDISFTKRSKYFKIHSNISAVIKMESLTNILSKLPSTVTTYDLSEISWVGQLDLTTYVNKKIYITILNKDQYVCFSHKLHTLDITFNTESQVIFPDFVNKLIIRNVTNVCLPKKCNLLEVYNCNESVIDFFINTVNSNNYKKVVIHLTSISTCKLIVRHLNISQYSYKYNLRCVTLTKHSGCCMFF